MKNLLKLATFFIFIGLNLSTNIFAEADVKVWLGLTVGKTNQKEFSTSAIVKEIEINSPAQKAGIMKGDLINSINQKKIKNPIQYIKTIKSLKKSDKIQIEIIRNKKYLKKKILLTTKKVAIKESELPQDYSLGFYGISTQAKNKIKTSYFSKEITDKYLFNGSKNQTLIVTCLRKGSQAEKSGIKLYDEIIEVGGKSLNELPNFNFSTKRNINIKILRNSKTLNIKTTSEHYNELDKLSLSCVDEYKEYECANIIQIDYDKRKNDYFDNLLSCIEEKNILTIPFGPIPDEYNWIKVDTVTNVVKQYASQETRNLEKLDFYLPIASEILEELNLYLNKNDKDKIALSKYENLRKSVTNANRYALVKGLKDSTVFEMNDGTINGYKKAITFLINKNQKISHLDRDIFDESFQALFEYGEKKFIYENWPKAIMLIDWQSLSLGEIKTFRMFYNLGDLYSSEPNYEEAIKYYDMGSKQLDKWAKNLPISRMYVVYKRRMHVKKSFQVSLFATKKYNETFENKYINMIEKNLKESEEVIKYFHSLPIKIKKEIRENNPQHLSDIYNAMNSAYGFIGKSEKMVEVSKKALEDLKKYSKGIDRNELIFNAYHQTLLASLGNNDIDDAVYYLNQAKNLATQLVSNENGLETVGYMYSFQLPMIINAGLYAEAEDILNFIDDFIEFDTSVVVGKFQEDTFNYTLGRLNLVKKDYIKAIYHFELASLNYLKKPGPGIYNMYSAFANLLLLEAYMGNKDPVRFEKHFELLTGTKPINYKSLNVENDLIGTSIAKNHYIPSDIDISILVALLDYLDEKKIKISKKDSKEFFGYLLGYFEDYAPGEESRLEMIRNSIRASSLLASNDIKLSEKFLTGLISEVKSEYTSELYDSNLTPIHKIDDIIEGYLNASLISKNKKFFDKSYKIIQVVSNSITAKDVKKSLKNKKFQDPEANKLIEKYQTLQIEKVSFTSGKEFDLSSSSESTFQDRELFDVSRSIEIDDELKNLEKKIKLKIPSYFKKIKPDGSSLKEIQSKLNTKQALLEYFFFEDKFYILIIKKDDHKIYKIDNTLKDLEKSAEAVRASIEVNKFGSLSKFNTLEGYKLYKKLFAPIESYISQQSEIIIIPNKFLKNIPLHLLPTNKTEECIVCSNVDWLMNKFDFAYVPNAAFFSIQKKKNILANIKIKSNKPIFLGIGNPNLEIKRKTNSQNIAKKINKLTQTMSRGSFVRDTAEIKNIYGLVEGSQEELETIQKYLVPSKSKLLLWDDANEKNIKDMNLKDFKIIHFATHGELAGTIKGQNEPFLVLTPPKIGTNENDGLLTMSEIMNLQNNAELVILSACNTAGGNIKQSEGFSGLARAFLFSGSKSVLVSNWYVETYAAMELTTGMMKQIKDNPKISTSKALSGSMKNFVSNNKEKSHPFYWAPFVIVGLNSNINLN